MGEQSLSACINADSSAAYGNRIHVKRTNSETNEVHEVVYGHFKKGTIKFKVGDTVKYTIVNITLKGFIINQFQFLMLLHL